MLLDYIDELFTPDHFLKPKYEIINRVDGQNVQIGLYEDNQLTITKNAIFPGNTDVVPFNKQSSIEFSHNRGMYNHNADPSNIDHWL